MAGRRKKRSPRKSKKATEGKITCKDCLKGTCKIHSESPVKTKRPSWDGYFMELAETAATRSTCLRHKIGAVLVRDRIILATGYNGSPKKMKHCTDVGCMKDRLKIPSGTHQEMCMAVHAEQNTIIQSALYGISSENSVIFITHGPPCSICTKMLINAGVKRVVYRIDYPDAFARKLLRQAKIKLVKLPAKKKK